MRMGTPGSSSVSHRDQRRLSARHTDLAKETVFARSQPRILPGRIVNKTNGITLASVAHQFNPGTDQPAARTGPARRRGRHRADPRFRTLRGRFVRAGSLRSIKLPTRKNWPNMSSTRLWACGVDPAAASTQRNQSTNRASPEHTGDDRAYAMIRAIRNATGSRA